MFNRTHTAKPVTFGQRMRAPLAVMPLAGEEPSKEDFTLWTGYQSAGQKALVEYRLNNRLGSYKSLADKV